MKKEKGVIFVATSQDNIDQAKRAALSIKKHSGALSMTIFTNMVELVSEDLFDNIIAIEKKGGSDPFKTYDKVIHLRNTPYDKTLFLDTDVYILDDISELFILLDKFDMAFAHAHCRPRTSELYHTQGALDINSIPYSFPTIQSGVILYKKSEKTWKTLDDYQKTYEAKEYFFDQASFKEVIWNSDLRISILPEEYNFNRLDLLKAWVVDNFQIAKPKIFHYTQNKKDDIEQLVNNILINKPTVKKQTVFKKIWHKLVK